MKRIIHYIMIILSLIVLFLLSTSEDISGEESKTLNITTPNIFVESPMTLSNNSLYGVNGKSEYLRLKMINGKYSEDWTPGAFMGRLWEGSCIFELSDEYGKSNSITDLSRLYKEKLLFTSLFEIKFDDYNNDGLLDFTLGQYASSNGNSYRIFTLCQNGNVEELPIKGYRSLFITNHSGYYSTKLTKVNKTSFKINIYDNSTSTAQDKTFTWNGKEFIETK